MSHMTLILLPGLDGSAEAIRAVRPDVQVRTIERPHLILQREPAAAWQEVSQFLN